VNNWKEVLKNYLPNPEKLKLSLIEIQKEYPNVFTLSTETDIPQMIQTMLNEVDRQIVNTNSQEMLELKERINSVTGSYGKLVDLT
tara:strand:+ start:99 stop:356 length:258 start_codon:yes stop_codon:yes gene_type:complete